MSRAARLAVTALLLVLATLALQLPDTTTTSSRPAEPRPVPAASTTPPALTPVRVNMQDRVGRAHRQRETRAFDARPLLAVLPLELAGVQIEIAGLAADGRRTVLEIMAGSRDRAYARALYEQSLAAYADPGSAYVVRWIG